MKTKAFASKLKKRKSPPKSTTSGTSSAPGREHGQPPRGGSNASTRKNGPSASASKSTTPSPSKPSSNALRDRLQAAVQLWRSDLSAFAMQALKIKDKAGTIQPFTLNRAQTHLHKLLTEQVAKTGKVRAIILKGRQQGISTYIQARFYWRTSLNRGLRAQILTHRQDASDHLFGMASRFLDNCELKPVLGAANAKELIFSKLDSGYQVATAGAKAIGRSTTCQLFHGSEVAFWDSADDHMAGIGQVVPDLPGTEIILESTANGVGNLFHRMWQDAQAGKSDYAAIFLPWFWQPEYRRSDGVDISFDNEEGAYAAAYHLDGEQMAWRRAKIVNDFSGDVNRFRQEYPATPEEAFVLVGVESFIPAALVLAAKTSKRNSGQGPLVVGVDPARFGKDSTAIVRRRGRVCLEPIERIQKADTMHVAGRVGRLIKEERPSRVFIDVGGLGAGIFDRLIELGFSYVVTQVNFGESAMRSERYVNRRAEMWGNMRDWLAQPPVALPNDDALAADLTGPQFSYDSEGRVKLEKKEDMAKRGIRSPDAGDALALTFAAPVGFDQPSQMSPASEAWDDLEQAAQRADNTGLPWAQTG